MSKKTRVLVLLTGGTILTGFDKVGGSLSLTKGAGELEESMGAVLQPHDVEVAFEQLMYSPSCYFTPETVFTIRERIVSAASEGFDGFVVLQGTDTLEESAYLMHLTLDCPKPVVFSGAMKSLDDLYRDAPGNLFSSILVAADPQAAGLGVLVVFNQRIYSARDVIKGHSEAMDAFFAPEFGPLGRVDALGIAWARSISRGRIRQPSVDSRVVLLKSGLGMGDFLLRASLDTGVKGMVLEGFGAGNVVPLWVPQIEKALRRGIYVVIVSRAAGGQAIPLYNYPGGGKQLQEMGAIFARGLNGLRARLKLMLLLGQEPTLSPYEVSRALQEDE